MVVVYKVEVEQDVELHLRHDHSAVPLTAHGEHIGVVLHGDVQADLTVTVRRHSDCLHGRA